MMLAVRAYMYQVSSSVLFFFVSYMHIHIPIMLKVGCCCFPRNDILLNMTLLVGSHRVYISPPSFMFVSATVSEIHELNQNKNSEIGYF